MSKSYDEIVSLVCDTLVDAGSTFREDKKEAYKKAIEKETNDKARWVLEQILENKRKMYGLFLKNMPGTKLIVCSGLPLPGRTQYWDATVKTNELLRKMCKETDRMVFMDATDVMLTSDGPEELRTSDGRCFNPALFRIDRIHLNKKGHDVWTAKMKETLRELGLQQQLC